MLDGDATTRWSNAFTKSATALLPAFAGARAEDWVSVDFGRARTLDRVAVSFTLDTTHALPASVEVAVWDGEVHRPVDGTAVDWATASDTPTVITFTPARGSRIRLTLTSAHPGETSGAVRISGSISDGGPNGPDGATATGPVPSGPSAPGPRRYRMPSVLTCGYLRSSTHAVP